MKKSIGILVLAVTAAGCGPRASSKHDGNNGGSNNGANNGGSNNGVTNNGGSNNGGSNNGASNNGATNNAMTNNTSGCEGCMASDVCVVGNAVDACGFGGTACVACDAGSVCFDGACVEPQACSPDTCAGCCDPVDGCVTGNGPAACGTDGAACSTCTGEETCDGVECVGPCSTTCAGCCDGEVCRVGTADESCGVAGSACADCGTGSSCNDGGACVSDSCASSCAGCCNGETCEPGTTASACGAGGGACETCGGNRTCEAQACEVSAVSNWELVLVSGRVSLTNPMGEPWDYLGQPDPVVDVTLYDASTNTSYRNTSTVAQDDATPTWNESQLTGVPAGAFLSWTLDVWDSDLDADDPFCSISLELDGDRATYEAFFDGSTYTLACEDQATGVFAELDVRLQPN